MNEKMEERWNAMNEKLKKGGKGMDEKGNRNRRTEIWRQTVIQAPNITFRADNMDLASDRSRRNVDIDAKRLMHMHKLSLYCAP